MIKPTKIFALISAAMFTAAAWPLPRDAIVEVFGGIAWILLVLGSAVMAGAAFGAAASRARS